VDSVADERSSKICVGPSKVAAAGIVMLTAILIILLTCDCLFVIFFRNTLFIYTSNAYLVDTIIHLFPLIPAAYFGLNTHLQALL
jgi:multidrug resistance efflux pump